jgi:hypothetical protein
MSPADVKDEKGFLRWVIFAGLALPVWCGCFFTVLGADVSSNLRFSHASHYRQNVSCETCHPLPSEPKTPQEALPGGWQPLRPSPVAELSAPGADSGGSPDPAGFGRPPEKRCLTCHEKARRTKDCRLCHLDRPGPTARKRERVLKGVRFEHDPHKKEDCLTCHPRIGDWDSLNGKQQETSMASCLQCHNGVKAKKSCNLCHSKKFYPRDHVRNFSYKHGIPYRANPQTCAMCHEDSSCVACHSRKPRNHTKAWIARRHGISASTNPDKCAACHADRDVCLRCHGTK